MEQIIFLYLSLPSDNIGFIIYIKSVKIVNSKIDIEVEWPDTSFKNWIIYFPVQICML
jgi:hypothetical protein